MKNSIIMSVILAGAFAMATPGHAQTVLTLTLKGTSQTTNDAGAIVSTQINNKTLIQDAITATGVSNAASLAVVYVPSASTDPSVQGDFVEVINNTNGTPVYTNLQFMYGGLFPQALTNADGSQIVIGAQVIPLPLAIGDSLGGATINEKITPKNTAIRGSFNYTALKTPAGSNTITICNGTFTSGKPFKLK
jgi:hypothetical protein